MIKTSLKEKLHALGLFNLVGLGLLWLYVGIYPSLKSESASYNKLIKSISPKVLKAFGASNSSVNSLANFLATKLYGFTWPLIISFLAISLASTMITGEIEQTTIGLWLSAPISRLSIYWSKYLAGLLLIVLSVVITIGGIVPLGHLYSSSIADINVLKLAVIGGLFALSVYSLTMLFATLFSKRSQVYVPLGIILVIMFTFNVVAALNAHLEKLQYFSFFYYFNSSNLLDGGLINHASYLMFGGVILVTSSLGALVFRRRDFII